MRDLHGYADRRTPEWSRPLAPLPDWLRSVDQLLQEHRPREQRESVHLNLDHARYLAAGRAERLAAWRQRLDLTAAKAAALLGYADEEQILRIERGERVKPDLERQRRLVEDHAPDAARDRCRWLRSWRHRMGFTCEKAVRVLGYSGRFNLYRVEMGHRNPSWEKVLVALAEERLRGGGRTATEPDHRARGPSRTRR